MPRGKQLSLITRGLIGALHSVDHSTRQIAVQVRRLRTAVHQCLQRLSNGSSDYATCPGRKTKTTARQDRMLKCLAIGNRRKTLRQLSFQLHQEADVAISCSTVRRRLHESELHSWRPRQKALLTDEHRLLR